MQTTEQKELERLRKALETAHVKLEWIGTWPGPDRSEPARSMAAYAQRAADEAHTALSFPHEAKEARTQR